MSEVPTPHEMEDAVRELDTADVTPATRSTVNRMRAEVLRLIEVRRSMVELRTEHPELFI